MAYNHAAIFKTPIFYDFLKNVVAQSGCGCELMFLRYQVGKNSILKLARCDKKDGVLAAHSAQGKHFDSWDVTVPQIAAERRECFFSLNSFYGSRKDKQNVCDVQNLFVDIDCHAAENVPARGKNWRNFVALLERKLKRDCLPVPYVVFTGRGLHLYWPITTGRKGKDVAPVWQVVERELGQYVQDLANTQYDMCDWNVDFGAMDVSRLVRFPGTYNKKARKWSFFVPTQYSDPEPLDTFVEFFLVNEKSAAKAYRKIPRQPRSLTFTKAEKAYALSRVKALEQLARSRGMHLEGMRNTFTTIYASMLAVAYPGTCEQKTLSFCRGFLPAQPEQEIMDTAICCKYKAYKWRDETIFARLAMSAEEIRTFKKTATYITLGKKLREKKQNKSRDLARNERKRKRADVYKRIPILYVNGHALSEIAKTLHISLSTVKRHLARLLRESTNREVKRYRRRKAEEAVAKTKKTGLAYQAKQHSAAWPICPAFGIACPSAATCDMGPHLSWKSCRAKRLLFFLENGSKWCVNKGVWGAPGL